MEAYAVDKLGSWTEWRSMPDHLKREMIELWHLQTHAENVANKSKKP